MDIFNEIREYISNKLQDLTPADLVHSRIREKRWPANTQKES